MHPNDSRTCSHCGGTKSIAAQRCRACYHPIRPLIDNGDGTHTVVLTRGARAIIDSADAPLVGGRNWSLNSAKGRPDYAARHEGGTSLYLHRLIIGAKPGESVDHINGNPMDCRRSNLRLATPQQNMANVPKRRRTRWYKGVQLRCDGKKWVARVQVNRETIHLGSFSTPEAAARAYDRAAIEHFGEFAGLNFPPTDSPATPRRRSAPYRPAEPVSTTR